MVMEQSLIGLNVIQQRAKLYRCVRQYFADQHILELDMNQLQQIVDQSSVLMTTVQTMTGEQTYRLAHLATPQIGQFVRAYNVKAYQISHVFAQPQHKQLYQEEVVLSWAIPQQTLAELQAEMTTVLSIVFEGVIEPDIYGYAQVMAHRIGLDVTHITIADLKYASRRLGLLADVGTDVLVWQQYLFQNMVEPTLAIDDIAYVQDCPIFAGQPVAPVVVYADGLAIGYLAMLDEQPVGLLMLDRLLMVQTQTRRIRRVQLAL
jgi:elongation factor P--beta-lysine ligase